MCFIVPKDSSADCMYEPLVQKLNEYLVDMEQVRRERERIARIETLNLKSINDTRRIGIVNNTVVSS